MNYSCINFSLDIHSPVSQVSLAVKKGETNKKLRISLIENGKPFKLTKDCAVVFSGIKPDGTILYNECIIKNNVIEYIPTEQTTKIEGIVDCEILVYGRNSQLLFSPSFSIVVYSPTYDIDNVLPSTDEFTALTQAMGKLETLIDQAKDVIGSNADDYIIHAPNYISSNTTPSDIEFGTHVCAVTEFDSTLPESDEEYTVQGTLEVIKAFDSIDCIRMYWHPCGSLNVYSRLPVTAQNWSEWETAQSGSGVAESVVNEKIATAKRELIGAADDGADKDTIKGAKQLALDLMHSLEDKVVKTTELNNAINSALQQAKESGEFDGEDGATGADGYTPQRGIDFWTETDKEEIVDDVVAEIPLIKVAEQPTFVNSVDEMTDTSKVYVMPDGYIWAYMSVIVPSVPLYTNLAVNFQEGHRFNSSGVTVEAAGATVCEDYIGPLTNGDIIRIKGFGGCTDYNSQWLNVNKVNYSCSILSSSSHYSYDYDSETGIVAIKKITDSTSFSYFRVSGKLTGTTDDVIITLNEEIKESAPTTGYQWANTGHAFVPANYEDRIIAIEEDVADMKDDILKLQNENNSSGGTSSETVTIPSYWESMVAEKTEIVKSLQTAGGKDCVCFVWASDTHIPDNDCGRTTDIGKVMAKMLDNCEIPFAVLSGDINTRASYSTEEKLLNAQKQMPIHLSPIWGTNRLLMALGNHDGCWGDSTGYYKHQFSPEEMWQAFFRGQALDFRRVFSNDGLYFYVDNTAQKTRFIVLNSHFGGDYAEDDNGWAVNDRFATSCYGQEQLEWLANIALDMPEGYGAIITAHVPPNIAYTVDKEQFIGIVNAYCNKTTYSGNYTAGVDGWTNNNISVDFSNAKGELIAMFTGHIHGDSIDTTTMDCPILTILSAGAKANEHNGFVEPEGGRTAGTDTETSFDVVTINKQTRTIDCIRVGAGIDREVNY